MSAGINFQCASCGNELSAGMHGAVECKCGFRYEYEEGLSPTDASIDGLVSQRDQLLYALTVIEDHLILGQPIDDLREQIHELLEPFRAKVKS